MSDVQNVIGELDDNVLPVLAVTRSAAKAVKVTFLVGGQEEFTHNPFPCSDPVGSTTAEPQLLSSFIMGQMAKNFEQALQTDPSLEQLRSLAFSHPAEGGK